VVIHSRIPIGIHVLAYCTVGTAHFVRSAHGYLQFCASRRTFREFAHFDIPPAHVDTFAA